MKARVKATGEIIEVSRYTGVMDDTNQRIYNWYEVETIDAHFTDNYWTRLEHQYVGMAMQGILACDEWNISPREGVSFAGEVALQAHELAHALVEKMKENEKAMH